MIHRKNLLVIKGKTKRLDINDFAGGQNSVLDDAYIGNSVAKVSFNVCGTSGALKEHLGAQAFKLPLSNGEEIEVATGSHKISKVWLFRRFDENTQTADDRIILLSAANKLYQICANNLSSGVTEINTPAFSCPPQAVNFRMDGQDVMIFCSEKDDLTVFDGVNTPLTVEHAPKFCGMCVHYDRLFAFVSDDRETLWFSDDLNPTNWNIGLDEAGYISMTDQRGGIIKLVSFLNYLYIFRDYGISRLTASGAQENFYLNHLFLAAGKIIGDTVALCGNKILFLTENGLYSFNGSSVQKILSRLDGFFEGQDNSNATAAFFNNKYFLSCNLNFGDGEKTKAEKNGCINNALVEVDLNAGSVNIMRGFDATSLAAINGENLNCLLFCSGKNQDWSYKVGEIKKGGKIFGYNLPKRWVCPKTDVDSAAVKKTLKYIVLTTLFDLAICVEADNQKHYFDVSGSELSQKIAINVSGQNFCVSFFADTEKMYVLKPQMYFREYG